MRRMNEMRARHNTMYKFVVAFILFVIIMIFTFWGFMGYVVMSAASDPAGTAEKIGSIARSVQDGVQRGYNQ